MCDHTPQTAEKTEILYWTAFEPQRNPPEEQSDGSVKKTVVRRKELAAPGGKHITVDRIPEVPQHPSPE